MYQPASLTVLRQSSTLSVRYLAPNPKARAAHTAVAEDMYAPAVKTTQHATKALAPGEPVVESWCSVPGVAYGNINGLGFLRPELAEQPMHAGASYACTLALPPGKHKIPF